MIDHWRTVKYAIDTFFDEIHLTGYSMNVYCQFSIKHHNSFNYSAGNFQRIRKTPFCSTWAYFCKYFLFSKHHFLYLIKGKNICANVIRRTNTPLIKFWDKSINSMKICWLFQQVILKWKYQPFLHINICVDIPRYKT